MSETLLPPEEQVLSTLRRDGSRRWLKPKLSLGKYWSRRRLVAYSLIVVFTGLPFVELNGQPLILLDIVARRFTILGYTFLPTDTVLLALFLVGLLLTIFLATAIFGRVWCGWACPQTVYLEFVFRPIERLFEGTSGRGGKGKSTSGWRMLAKYLVYLAVSFYLANTFLAYFVGVDALSQWMRQSPLQHPIPFLVMAAVTGLMMFDFCFFREQLCIIACPYGRFQSVLLDQDSLIVSYDKQRGEPRGKVKKQAAGSLPVLGDCVDCKLCVTTCPTGIDIRNGLQMECVNCTQCMDACDAVMQKLGRPLGLIRYSSQARDAGKRHGLLRPRLVIYPAILTVIATLFFTVFLNKAPFNAMLLREPGNPFTITDDGQVHNPLRLKLTNRTDQPMTIGLQVTPTEAELELSEDQIRLEPQSTETFHLNAVAAPDLFRAGRLDLRITLTNDAGAVCELPYKMLGPRATRTSNAQPEKADSS